MVNGSFLFFTTIYCKMKVMNNWSSVKQELEKLVNEGVSYESIGKIYGCSGSNIKKQCKKLGIVLTPRRVINGNETFNRGKKKSKKYCENCGKELTTENAKKYCSSECQREKEYKLYIERWKSGLENGVTGCYGISGHIRRYLFEKNNCKCQICGWGEENPITHKIPLQIHHKDGDCLNNKEENLELLCPNHHSLTETYGNLNKDSKRIFRKQKGNK